MEIIAFVIRVIMAGVFAVAAITKIAGYRSFRDSLEEFGVPSSSANIPAVVIPIAELAVAALLLIPAYASISAFAALTLLCIFTTAILYNLVLGRRPECNCFGQIRSSPIGSGTLIRNGLLLLGALLLSSRAFGVTASIAVLIAFTIVLLLTLLAKALERQRDILDRLAEIEDRDDAPLTTSNNRAREPLPPGTPAPAFRIQKLDGKEVTLDDVLAKGRPSIFIFLSNRCGSCVSIMPSISHWHGVHADKASFVVIGKGSEESFTRRLGKLKADWILLDREQQVTKQYRATASPAAVIVRPDGSIGSTMAFGENDITSLVEHAGKDPSVTQVETE